jgi:hypothetical protein
METRQPEVDRLASADDPHGWQEQLDPGHEPHDRLDERVVAQRECSLDADELEGWTPVYSDAGSHLETELESGHVWTESTDVEQGEAGRVGGHETFDILHLVNTPRGAAAGDDALNVRVWGRDGHDASRVGGCSALADT